VFVMRKIAKLIIVIGVVPLFVCAMSQDEQENYINIENKYIKLDQELNDLYKYQIKEYKEEGGEFYGESDSRDVFLKRSQQIWIKMRDADCNYETYESKKGAGFQSIYTQCLLNKTNDRIKYLKDNN